MDRELRQFMQYRGISEEIILKMERDKVDRYVIQASTCDTLARYLQHHGDQLAVQSFCSKESKSIRGSDRPSKHRKILASLRRKLLLKSNDTKDSDNSDTEHSEAQTTPDMPKSQPSSTYLTGNKNAFKNTRKIEIGWLHKENDAFIQIRKKKGGGTRKIDISKDTTQIGILQAAKSLFFHNGISPLGNVDAFNFNLCDYSETPMGSSQETVGQMYKRTGLNILRFYMATETRAERETNKTDGDRTRDTDDTLPDLDIEQYPYLCSVVGHSDEEVFFNFKELGTLPYTPPLNKSLEQNNLQQTPMHSLSPTTGISPLLLVQKPVRPYHKK